MLWVQGRLFCWELAETTGAFSVFLSSTFSETARTPSSNKCLGTEEAGNLVMTLALHFLQAHFIFGETFTCLGKRSAV